MEQKEKIGLTLIIITGILGGSILTQMIQDNTKDEKIMQEIYKMNGYTKIGKDETGKQINGLFFPTTQAIVLYPKKQTEEQLIHTALHEIGHWKDYQQQMQKIPREPLKLTEETAENYANNITCTTTEQKEKEIQKIYQEAYKIIEMPKW